MGVPRKHFNNALQTVASSVISLCKHIWCQTSWPKFNQNYCRTTTKDNWSVALRLWRYRVKNSLQNNRPWKKRLYHTMWTNQMQAIFSNIFSLQCWMPTVSKIISVMDVVVYKVIKCRIWGRMKKSKTKLYWITKRNTRLVRRLNLNISYGTSSHVANISVITFSENSCPLEN